MPQLAIPSDTVRGRIAIHLLNEGLTAYGDCILCIFGTTTVLIDGSHPGDETGSDRIARSIPEQLAALLGQSPDSLHVNLLIVSHTHADHFGCLPALISSGTLKADWALLADPKLGWGHTSGEDTDATLDPRVRAAMDFARDDTTEDLPFSASLFATSDARVSQEDTYTQMVDSLETSAKVVLYRASQPSTGQPSQQQLIDFFARAGLQIEILGPSAKQLTVCSDGISKSLATVRDLATAAIKDLASDSSTTLVLDNVFSDSRNPTRAGNFVNLQSVVMVLTYAGKKFLFNGDMQLVDPTTQFSHVPVPNEIYDELKALKQRIAAAAPFDFAKLGHHGSHNATDADYIQSLGDTVLFGITLGQFSPGHPSPETLEILKSLRQKIQWLRTDFNGLCSFYFDDPGVRYETERGQINDLQPNPGKRGAGPEDALAILRPVPTSQGAEIQTAVPVSVGGTLVLDAHIPFGAGEAAVHLRITPPSYESGSTSPGAPGTPSKLVPNNGSRTIRSPDSPSAEQPLTASVAPPPLDFASGRKIPKLLFVTSEATLIENIGKDETRQALEAVRSAGMVVISDLPSKQTVGDFSAVSTRVNDTLRQDPTINGVVLLGGMDVVPSRQIDTLPQSLRKNVRPADDPFDNFIVWCDDEYGRRGAAEFLPVSRIPDGQFAPLVFKALSAPNSNVGPKFRAIRNLARPFATQISPAFPDDPAIFLVSGPTLFNNPTYVLEAEKAYIMLHGDFADGREFVGESANGQYLSAMRMENVPEASGHVIFAGCCWGALTTTTTASRASITQAIQSKGHNGSIALKFLEKGALGFVGCTGAHYPPQRNESINTLGGAMHKAFWDFYLDGSRLGPAAALNKAKRLYLQQMPHGQDDPFRIAVEYKTYYQFTCLGLGW